MVVASGGNSFTKEMSIRRRISSIFNKREEDFPSLKEYNDYLEEVEDMKTECGVFGAVVNLVEGIDVPAIEVKIVQYQRENAEQIMVAHARKAEDYAAALAASKSQPMQGENGAVDNKSELGLKDQTEICFLFINHEIIPPAVTLKQGPALCPGQYACSCRRYNPGAPLGMAQQPAPVGYGSGHESEDAENMKERFEKAARAGGWSMEFSKKRALEEAFGSIWI
ncbi:hypothetical protein Leryth_001179 [Lithospermum erythrorhizon]|nr:hypothetical protein Leryth_001179 [Lithospermum erythrorhizon]